MKKAFSMDKNEQGIATLTFDLPDEKVNTLSLDTMNELEELIDLMSSDSSIKGLMIKSAKEGVFIAGADIKDFTHVQSPEEAKELAQRGQNVFRKLDKLPFPTVAVINGVCLGGGLELALSCDYRVVTDHPKTSLGLPEVQLGIIPAWGGTQRLPRLIGLQQALGMILPGKAVPAAKAFKMHLADAVVPEAFKDAESIKFMQQVLDPKMASKIRQRRKTKGFKDCFLEKNPIGRSLVFKQAKKSLLEKTKGKYPAPLAALDTIKQSIGGSIDRGLEKEALSASSLFSNPCSKNLIGLFFIDKEIKKQGSEEIKNFQLKKIENVGVLGAGIMGGGIAWLFAHKGHDVRMKDVSSSSLAKGFAQANKIYSKLIKIRKIKPWDANMRMHRISGSTEYAGFQHCDMVVEAIVENLDIKKKVLRELEDQVSSDCIICSNTSSLSITEMAKAMKHPERFVGLHFFNPVNRMPLVEIIPGEQTSRQTVLSMLELVKKTGKTPVVVKDCTGFLVNRILTPNMDEAGHLFEEGFDPEYVDEILEDFGMPMGAYVLIDEVGIDVAAKVAKVHAEAYPDRMIYPKIYDEIVEKGMLGKKNGKGFYLHKGKKRTINPEMLKLQKKGSKKKGESESMEREIVDRMILCMINEAARCIEEEVIESPEFLDMAMIMGTGFPPFRGGPLRFADSLGIGEIVRRLDQLAGKHGPRFQPAPILRQMDMEGKLFYNN
ncbi:MAG: fatty-acid oxidation protein subunit alpha [Waddliaceae bacterium]|nr:fatty-acid oxidation protein subunit alpha [Waddliaceae bacterium]